MPWFIKSIVAYNITYGNNNTSTWNETTYWQNYSHYQMTAKYDSFQPNTYAPSTFLCPCRSYLRETTEVCVNRKRSHFYIH